MKKVTLFIALAVAGLGLSGCGDGTGTARYIIDPPDSAQRTGDQLGATELKEVSLPDYAAADEISWQDADGAVRASNKVLWADKPERAFTITLARAISEISGASVVPEPWPFPSPPKHRLDVRVEQALAANDGYFHLKGRYFVAAEGSGAGSHHARVFDIAVPVDQNQPDSVADAASVAITMLAEQIAGLGGPGTTIVATVPGGGDPYANLPPLF
ncbi:MAG TPA: ABC-type transport auxiliary lipoprotein family protein [Paracoccus sp. (in: a-proteobacteria)]|uniref:PqiC family protein n=1 Tax=uncultured Paracoccus sp. TaxID=189685 RepID=UPI0026359DEB|nr:ABC-type transport auxiliary lipoprotein family protein [uncultured Paracoccus sp.]HMQ40644.1 ABC-type transport auxiliary lipoprotein family protein [Paracoccus sp. (in: a-proteobacteria)]HMR36266.1 ABC-type transport auxiliary lipoprotein family protein [Paracoccus sp. (in: a-proteobacteria)]